MDANTLVNGSWMDDDVVEGAAGFVLGCAPGIRDRIYIVVTQAYAGDRFTGYTHSQDTLPEGFILPPGKDIFVAIEAGSDVPYPHAERFENGAKVVFYNPVEEFVHVLAHEVGHAIQIAGEFDGHRENHAEAWAQSTSILYRMAS